MHDIPRRRVAVALIEQEGKILIARRKAGGPFSGLWELPGGKCGVGEDPALCVIREVAEETGLNVLVEAPAAIIEHSYPDFSVEIYAFFCRAEGGIARPLQSEEIAWVRWEEMSKYQFPEANEKLFRKIDRLKNPGTMKQSIGAPPARKFVAIGVALGILGGSVLGVLSWIAWDSAASFASFLAFGAIAGGWFGRGLRLIEPDELEKRRQVEKD